MTCLFECEKKWAQKNQPLLLKLIPSFSLIDISILLFFFVLFLPSSFFSLSFSYLMFRRDVDMVTPCCTQLTYEGLIDEVFQIQNCILSLHPHHIFSSYLTVMPHQVWWKWTQILRELQMYLWEKRLKFLSIAATGCTKRFAT
jgi:Sec1 family